MLLALFFFFSIDIVRDKVLLLVKKEFSLLALTSFSTFAQ